MVCLKSIVMLLLLTLLFQLSVFCQESPSTAAAQDQPITLDMQWFLSYLSSEENSIKRNEFALKRGYVNIKKKINSTYSGRITTDITVDHDGDGEGDVEIRLKYLYLKTRLPTHGLFNMPYVEFGLVHRPWLDFEQHVNLYRSQGTMFLERQGVVSSGDYGVVLVSLLGEELNENYRKTVNSSYAGTWGSVAVGIFNGGGYHALEKNPNKTIEWRCTLRPLHQLLPGLQLTYHGAIGKGNIAQEPDWDYHSGYLSYETKQLVITGEYYQGNGNYKGSAFQDTLSYAATPQQGYSFFGEWKIPNTRFSLFGRSDYFIQEFLEDDLETRRTIAGIALHFIRGSKLFLDYDHMDQKGLSSKEATVIELAIELKY